VGVGIDYDAANHSDPLETKYGKRMWGYRVWHEHSLPDLKRLPSYLVSDGRAITAHPQLRVTQVVGEIQSQRMEIDSP